MAKVPKCRVMRVPRHSYEGDIEYVGGVTCVIKVSEQLYEYEEANCPFYLIINDVHQWTVCPRCVDIRAVWPDATGVTSALRVNKSV